MHKEKLMPFNKFYFHYNNANIKRVNLKSMISDCIACLCCIWYCCISGPYSCLFSITECKSFEIFHWLFEQMPYRDCKYLSFSVLPHCACVTLISFPTYETEWWSSLYWQILVFNLVDDVLEEAVFNALVSFSNFYFLIKNCNKNVQYELHVLTTLHNEGLLGHSRNTIWIILTYVGVHSYVLVKSYDLILHILPTSSCIHLL